MNPHELLLQRVRLATHTLLGEHFVSNQILDWCDELERQCESILSSRSIGYPSIAVIGAKGQGKTWIARQFIRDVRVAQSLPTGVLSSEATTHLHWIGPVPPDSLNPSHEIYHPCRQEDMLDLKRPYLLLDTPGVTDDDLSAAKVAKDALALSPIKLLVVRRDQMRGAILSTLANITEGSICIPIINCVPIKEMRDGKPTESVAEDLHMLFSALRASAPKTRLLNPILVPDFEADGDEAKIGSVFAMAVQTRLQNESLDEIAATRSNRLLAATDRLRHRIKQTLDLHIPQLSSAVRKLHEEANALPYQTIEAVLGSRNVLNAAVRGRLRAQIVTDTSLLWFPYRTVLSTLGLTHGAWDRLLMSLSGSVPSIFGTFAAWARNFQTSQKVHWEMTEGIRDRLNRQMQDRLGPVQAQFQRTIQRIQGTTNEHPAVQSNQDELRLSGVEELQSRSRTVFEWCVDRHRTSSFFLQLLALLGCLVFWVMMAGPIVWVYKKYFIASYNSLASGSVEDLFPHEIPTLLFASGLLSLLPLLLYTMVIFTCLLRRSKIERIASNAYSEQLKLVEELQRTGVISLHFDNPLLEHAEYLINLSSPTKVD